MWIQWLKHSKSIPHVNTMTEAQRLRILLFSGIPFQDLAGAIGALIIKNCCSGYCASTSCKFIFLFSCVLDNREFSLVIKTCLWNQIETLCNQEANFENKYKWTWLRHYWTSCEVVSAGSELQFFIPISQTLSQLITQLTAQSLKKSLYLSPYPTRGMPSKAVACMPGSLLGNSLREGSVTNADWLGVAQQLCLDRISSSKLARMFSYQGRLSGTTVVSLQDFYLPVAAELELPELMDIPLC